MEEADSDTADELDQDLCATQIHSQGQRTEAKDSQELRLSFGHAQGVEAKDQALVSAHREPVPKKE